MWRICGSKLFLIVVFASNLSNFFFRYTPLHEAAAKGKFDICKFLLHHGADSTKKNRDGNTPSDLVKEDDDDVADLLRGKRI